jgi:hypothetical protein
MDLATFALLYVVIDDWYKRRLSVAWQPEPSVT